jgi:hypothetical protein
MEDIFAPRKRRVRYGLRPELGLYHEELAPSEAADLIEFLSLLPSASDPRPIRREVMTKAWQYLDPSVREQLKSALRRAWAEVRR